MTEEASFCTNCAQGFAYELVHARLSDQGYMYCDSDDAIVTWDSMSASYTAFVGDVHPWMLDQSGRELIEASVVDCPYGGHFSFSAVPRCAFCQAEVPDLIEDPTYYAITGRHLDGAMLNVWKGN